MDEPHTPDPPTHYPSQDERDAWAQGYQDGRQGLAMDIGTNWPNAYANGFWHGVKAHKDAVEAAPLNATPDGPPPLWAIEFRSYPAAEMPTIPYGWTDESWHNDACPCFRSPDGRFRVFIDFPDLDDREFSASDRFNVLDDCDPDPHGETLTYSSNSWDDVLAFIRIQQKAACK
jgi:hypothetical protein